MLHQKENVYPNKDLVGGGIWDNKISTLFDIQSVESTTKDHELMYLRAPQTHRPGLRTNWASVF